MSLQAFSVGAIGDLDAAFVNEVVDAVNRFNALFPRTGGDPGRASRTHEAWFQARITGFQAIAGATNRWEYSWVESIFNRTTKKWQDLSGGITSATEGFAYNTIENDNNGTGIEAPGVNVSGADYPAGFDLQPIQGNPIVEMTASRALDGVIVYSFTCPNDHDGTCAAAVKATAPRGGFGGGSSAASFAPNSPPGGAIIGGDG